MSAFTEACDDVMAAATFLELAGFCGDNPEAVYRDFVKMVHPDKVPDEHKAAATGATARLVVLWDEFNGRPTGGSGPVTISTKKRTYILSDNVIIGTIANLYPVSWNDGDVHHGVLKMPRSPRDTDLMEREAKALKTLDKANSDYRHFAPTLVETFRHKDPSTKEIRRANVFEPLDEFITLENVKSVFPSGLDPRDLAWIWRRLFVAIGLAHDNGLAHGAVTPDNVMIHPVQHGVVLVGWGNSCNIEEGQTVPTMVPGFEWQYPTSVGAKEPASSRVDIYMMAAMMIWMLGPSSHSSKFRAFARGCQVSTPPPAATLLAEFDELLDTIYGQRRYRELVMP